MRVRRKQNSHFGNYKVLVFKKSDVKKNLFSSVDSRRHTSLFQALPSHSNRKSDFRTMDAKMIFAFEALMTSNFFLLHLSFDGFRVSVESKLSVRWDRQWILAGLLHSTLNLTWRKVHSAVFVSNCFLFMGRFGQFHCFLIHRIIQIIRER